MTFPSKYFTVHSVLNNVICFVASSNIAFVNHINDYCSRMQIYRIAIPPANAAPRTPQAAVCSGTAAPVEEAEPAPEP